MARRLKNWLEAYLKYTENTEPKEIFRRWVGISTIASCMERKLWASWGFDKTFANMFIVLVGPPGRPRKTTAIRQGYDLLQELDIKISADVSTKEALIRDLAQAARLETATSGDKTQMQIHSSLTVHSEELTVFLGYHNIELMTDLGAWYDCKDRWEYRTKGQGTDYVRGVWVNLLGATTPELLQESIPKNLIGGGFASRLNLIYEETIQRPVPYYEVTNEDKKLREDLIADLREIQLLSGQFKMSQGYIDNYSAWYEMQIAAPAFSDPRLLAYESRRPMHVRKLSMILNVARTDNLVLEEEDLLLAVQTLEEGERNLRLVYQDIGAQPLYELEKRVTMWVKAKLANGPFPVSELVKEFQSAASNDDLTQVISRLDLLGICFLEREVGHGKALVFPGRALSHCTKNGQGV